MVRVAAPVAAALPVAAMAQAAVAMVPVVAMVAVTVLPVAAMAQAAVPSAVALLLVAAMVPAAVAVLTVVAMVPGLVAVEVAVPPVVAMVAGNSPRPPRAPAKMIAIRPAQELPFAAVSAEPRCEARLRMRPQAEEVSPLLQPRVAQKRRQALSPGLIPCGSRDDHGREPWPQPRIPAARWPGADRDNPHIRPA
jgi:hypothetical protein